MKLTVSKMGLFCLVRVAASILCLLLPCCVGMVKLSRIQALERDYAAGKIPEKEYVMMHNQMVADYNAHQAAVAATVAAASSPQQYDLGYNPNYYSGANAYNPSYYSGANAYNPNVYAPYRPNLSSTPGRHKTEYNPNYYGGAVKGGTPASYNTGKYDPNTYGGVVKPGSKGTYNKDTYNPNAYGGVVQGGTPGSYNKGKYDPNTYGGVVQPGSKGSYNKAPYKTDAHGTSYLSSSTPNSGYATGAYDPSTGKVDGGGQVASPWLLKGKPEIEKHEADKKRLGPLGSLWNWTEEKVFESETGGMKGMNNSKKVLK